MPIEAAKHITNYAECEVYQEMMKRTGVNLEFIHPAQGEEKTQFNLLVASGDLPDILGQMDYYAGGSDASVKDGISIDLNEYVKEYAPDFYKAATSDIVVYRDLVNQDEEFFAFALIKDRMPPFERLNVRKDVMEELGIEEIPETIADYEAAFEKMKAAGMTGFCLPTNGYAIQFSRPFDVMNGFQLDADGKVIFGQVQEGFKQYLELMADWYQKGYISSDFMSLTGNDVGALFDSKKLGFYINPVGNTFTHAEIGGYDFTPLPYPRLEEGQQLHLETVSINKVEGNWTTVSSQCEYPEIAVQFLNYTYTQEGADLANWGIEGLSWNEVNGEKVFTDRVLKNPDVDRVSAQYIYKLHLIPKLAEPDVVCGTNIVYSDKSREYRMMWSDDDTIDDTMVLPGVLLTKEDNAERAKIMTEINTYVDEMVLKFITGAAPLSDWDAFVAQVESMNLARALELTQNAYDVYMEKQLPEG